MEEKKKLLSKLNIKDYKNDFELILDGKKYDEEAKSLLLNIFYKLDNFYKDYMTVKPECDTKNKYIEDFISLIQFKCNKIIIIQPQNIKNNEKYCVDRKNGAIQCIPNECILFYAVNELRENTYENEKYLFENFVNKCINFTLSKGKAINNTEPIRDFNGWSWNPQIESNDNIMFNLVYQNMLMIYGREFLDLNVGNANITTLLKNKITELGFSDAGEKFINNILELCVILYSNYSAENKEKCVKYKNRLASKIKMIESREEFINDAKSNGSSLEKRIKKIDEMLNNISILREEFRKCINMKKTEYIGISDFVEEKEREKQRLLLQISINSNEEQNKNKTSEQTYYKQILSYFDDIETKKINVQAKIIKVEKHFFECINVLIDKAETKKDIFALMKLLRYYSNILIKKDKYVITLDKILIPFEEICEKLTIKMKEKKVIDLGFESNKLCNEIMKYVFRTKIIELENITLKIAYIEGGKIEVGYYDSKVLEYKKEIDIPFDEVIVNKKDRKIKLFKLGG